MKVLVFGGSGLVGSQFIELKREVFEIFAPDSSKIDILNKDQISQVFEEFSPDAVINFAAFTDVQAAEEQKDDKEGICFRINAEGAKKVANVSKGENVHLVHISTEYVFDGEKKRGAYTERDVPNPKNWYGKTKYFGDNFVLDSGCLATIVRISMPYSPNYEAKLDIARFFVEELKLGNKINAIEDQRITPTLVSDIANALEAVVGKRREGVYHVSATDDISPFEFAKLLAKAFSLDESLIEPLSLDEYNKDKKAPLLKFSRLDPSKFISVFGEGILHSVEEGVQIFKNEVDAKS